MSAAWLESDRVEGAYDRALIRWVLGYARPHWWQLLGCVVLLLVLAGLQLAQPWLISQAIDQVLAPAGSSGPRTGPAAVADLRRLVELYFVAVLGTVAIHYVQLYWLRITGQAIISQVRADAFTHLQRLGLSYFDRQPVGRTVTRVTNDVEALNEVYTSVLVNLFRDVFFMAGAAILLVKLDWRLALLAFCVLPIVAITAILFRRTSRSAWRDMRTRLATINATLAESFSGVRVTQLFTREAESSAEFRAVNDGYYDAARHLIRVFAVFSPALDLLTSVALALIVWYGGNQVLIGALTLGTLYAFTAYVRRLYEPVNALAEKFNILQSALAAAERIQQFLGVAPDVVDEVGGGQTRTEHGPRAPGGVEHGRARTGERDGREPAVVFEDVWFAYNPGEWVLKGVSFAVPVGQTVAFVGHTGAGKSTLMNLLPRFYDVQRGAVRVQGVDVRQWPQRVLRQRVGAVMQDVFLFAGDIAGNICLGDEAIAQADIERAAVTVGADAFIRRLPGGYDAPVVERGMSLSTGERQLIAFARALAFDPAILVLDEATASVDTDTEAAVQAAMRAAARDRTTLIVAHRLSTVVDADCIHVLDHGHIVESGRHDELLTQGGFYQRLWDLQRAAQA